MSDLTAIKIPVHIHSLYNLHFYENPIAAAMDLVENSYTICSVYRDPVAFSYRSVYRNALAYRYRLAEVGSSHRSRRHGTPVLTYRTWLDTKLRRNSASGVELMLHIYKHSEGCSGSYSMSNPCPCSQLTEIILETLVKKIKERNITMVSLILEQELLLERISTQSFTPLRNAWYDLLEHPVFIRDKEMIQLLLDIGAVPDKDILKLGIQSRDIAVLDMLPPEWRECDPFNTISDETILLLSNEGRITKLLQYDPSVNWASPSAPLN